MPDVGGEDPVGWVGSWSPGIGDPTVMGWLTVFAYITVAVLCFQAFKAQKRTPDARVGWRAWLDALDSLWKVFGGLRRPLREVPGRARAAAFWLVLGILLLLLGVNKQLDLQSLITEIGRISARAQGWYEIRRLVQVAFIGAVTLLALVIVVAALRLLTGLLGQLWLPVMGMAILLVFVLVRATSFHAMDLLINTSFLGAKMNWLLELGGIALVGIGAVRALRRTAPVGRG